MGEQERKGVHDVLRAAAMTYVAGAASSAGYIIYLAILGSRWIFRRPPLQNPILKPPPVV